MSTLPDKITLETSDTTALGNLLLPIHPDDHVQGLASARLTLVEYGDYECPACGALFTTIRQLHTQMNDDMRFVFRHYPLSGRHPRAQMAAEAAEAAGAQEKFWDMHDLLFEHQAALAEKDLVRYAEQLALDMDRFQKDLRNRTFEERVREDFKRGVANGVYGTPGLFVNGIRYNGTLDAQSLSADLEAVEQQTT